MKRRLRPSPPGSRRPRSPARPLLLAGDIGGTKTHLALFAPGADPPVPLESERFASRDFAGLEPILGAFLAARRARIVAAAFGVAGPVVDARSEATNLPWIVDARALSARLRAPVVLLNDLEATAHSIPALAPGQLAVLNPGEPADSGAIALIAAGTGLGEAFALRHGERWLVGASEGGHCDFAPRNTEELDLLRFLLGRFDHVSVERVLSGPGLVHLYEFLIASSRGEDSRSVRERMSKEDPAAVISKAAIDGTSKIATEALRLFATIYGAEAGNLALKVLATRGVYVGGGIAPKILPVLQSGAFLGGFLAKGRFASLLAKIPVRVILDDRAALLGAARVARVLRRAGASPARGRSPGHRRRG